MSKKQQGINPDLEKAIGEMLKHLEDYDIDQKLKVIDRAINLEKIKQKISDDAYGSGFLTEDDV